MKTKTLKLTALMLITAGIFTACSCIEIEIHDETCPIKETLVGGRWHFIGFYYPHTSDRDIFPPIVSFEYFSDGIVRLFSSGMREYWYGMYRVEVRKGTPFPWAPDEIIEYWHLYRYFDGSSEFNFVGIFRGDNKKAIFHYNWGWHRLRIYQRKQ